MRKFSISSAAAILLVLLMVFGIFSGAGCSLLKQPAEELEYIPYVMDSEEDLSAPSASDTADTTAASEETTTTTTTTTTTAQDNNLPFYEDWEDDENWDEWGNWDTYSGYDLDETTTTVKTTTTTTKKTTTANNKIHEDGSYYTKNDVALYIHIYGHLPDNFITKNEARDLGWSGGSVEKYAKGKAIGGDHFGNYEGTLPRKKGRYYTECDIDTYGKKSRGAKRIVFSNDGLIYYTNDHYETFELLYGNEGD